MIKPYYQDQFSTIYCGDCLKILQQITTFADIVLTSPPYNVGLKYDSYKDTLPQVDFETWCERVLASVFCRTNDKGRAYFIISEQMLWFFKQLAEKTGWTFVQKLVWCKPNLAGGARISYDWNGMTEDILLFRKGKRTPMKNSGGNTHNFFVIPSPQTNFKTDKKIHIAQFSEKLCFQILSRTPGEVVMDPFCGSGTVLKAAKSLGLKSIGIEISEKYCEIAAKRLQEGLF